MAVSYQTIARYDEDCTRKCRARDLDDIRIERRKTLHKTRLQLKSLQMLQNRRTLAQTLFSDIFDDDEFTHDDQVQYSSPTSALETPCSWGNLTDWSSAPIPQNYPSPTWSSSGSTSTNSSGSLQFDEHDIPAFFYETPPHSTHHPRDSSDYQTSSRKNKHKQPFGREHIYKQHSSASTSPRPRNYLQLNKIHSDFQELKTVVCGPIDPGTINKLMYLHWPVLLDAICTMQSDVSEDASNLLNTLVAQKILQPPTVLHLLQNGLIFRLHNVLKFNDNGCVIVTKILLSITKSIPNIIPYLVDLMVSSNLFHELETSITDASIEDVRLVIEFYYQVTETAMSQVIQDTYLQPLIPDILLLTGLSKDTVDSYSPTATMKKCLNSTLIKRTVDRCICNASQKDENLVNMTLVLLANSLKLAHIQSVNPSADIRWVQDMVSGFRGSLLECKLRKLMRALERLIEISQTSAHCSQGAGVDGTSAQTLGLCRQFLTFYQEYYGNLMAASSQLEDGAKSAT